MMMITTMKTIQRLHSHHGILLLVVGLLLHPFGVHASSTFFQGSNNEVYTNWLNNVSYEKAAFIESTSISSNSSNTDIGVAMHWTITNDIIHLAIVAQATGWVAFGLAESGSMRGADIVTYTASTNTITDSHVLDQLVQPITDECQNWLLVNSIVDDGFIIFEASRYINTNDTQDRSIIDDSFTIIPTTRVIAAWGDTTLPSFHGKNVARSAIRFFGTSDNMNEKEAFQQTMNVEADGSFIVAARNFIIPSDVTTYKVFCFNRNDLVNQGVPMNQDLHTIGFEPIVQSENKKFVHHFILYGSSNPWNRLRNRLLGCENYPLLENAYGWAPGELPLTLPPYVGGPLGTSGFQSFALEIHYNNVDMIPDIPDSSGVKIYYTTVKRQYDLGIFQVGDPFVSLVGTSVSPFGGLAQHSFACDGQCLTANLAEPVTVLRESLHMHKTAVSMVNHHIRNNQVIRTGKVDFWDFDQQGDFSVVQAPFQMNPGDSFRTVCNYNSSNKVSWGLASQEEMCIAFLYYYPRKLIRVRRLFRRLDLPLVCGLDVADFLPDCEVEYSATPNFTTYDQLQRSFGSTPSTCSKVLSATPISAPAKIPVQPSLTTPTAPRLPPRQNPVPVPSRTIQSPPIPFSVQKPRVPIPISRPVSKPVQPPTLTMLTVPISPPITKPVEPSLTTKPKKKMDKMNNRK